MISTLNMKQKKFDNHLLRWHEILSWIGDADTLDITYSVMMAEKHDHDNVHTRSALVHWLHLADTLVCPHSLYWIFVQSRPSNECPMFSWFYLRWLLRNPSHVARSSVISKSPRCLDEVSWLFLIVVVFFVFPERPLFPKPFILLQIQILRWTELIRVENPRVYIFTSKKPRGFKIIASCTSKSTLGF